MLGLVFGQRTGCIGLFILIVDIVCIVQIAETGKSTLKKVLWIVFVVLCPVLGALVWLLLGK
jgi:hypothetical protein